MSFPVWHNIVQVFFAVNWIWHRKLSSEAIFFIFPFTRSTKSNSIFFNEQNLPLECHHTISSYSQITYTIHQLYISITLQKSNVDRFTSSISLSNFLLICHLSLLNWILSGSLIEKAVTSAANEQGRCEVISRNQSTAWMLKLCSRMTRWTEHTWNEIVLLNFLSRHQLLQCVKLSIDYWSHTINR